MVCSTFSRKLWFAVVAAGFLAVAGCSSQPDNQASNKAPAPSSKAAKAVPAPKKAAAPEAKVVPASAKVAAPAKVAEPIQGVTIPKGTALTATVGQTLAADKMHQGDSFSASLSSSVKVDGKTVLPKGAHLTGKIVAIKKHELKVELASVTVHGKAYDLETNSRRPSDQVKPEKGKETAAQEKQKKDNSTLNAKTRLTFKLSKPVTVPAKG